MSRVILQVLADAGQVVIRLDACVAQSLRIADARQLQDLRRLHRARAEQHVAARLRARPRPADRIVHRDRPPLLDDDAGRPGAGQHGEVRPRQHRAQIRRRGAPALAVRDRKIVPSEPFLARPVEVVGDRISRLLPRGDQRVVERAVGFPGGNAQRPRAAVQRTLPAMMPFEAPEIGQHIVERPARQPQLPPLVVILAMAARVDHAVDRRAAPQPLAARPPQPSAVEVRFGFGLEPPVALVAALDKRADARRHAHQHPVVAPARLQQQHAHRRVLGQPCGEHATRRPGANDDIVVPRTVLHPRALLSACAD